MPGNYGTSADTKNPLYSLKLVYFLRTISLMSMHPKDGKRNQRLQLVTEVNSQLSQNGIKSRVFR